MNCNFQEIEQPNEQGRRRVRCSCCDRTLHPTRSPLAQIRAVCQCAGAEGEPPPLVLSPDDTAELFPGEDPTLLGNRIARLTAAIGIPACGGCEVRKEWLNRAHAYVREYLQPA